MTNLLLVVASPRGTNSKSVAIADAYLAKLKANAAGLTVDTIDLGQEKLPDFDGNKVNAKLAVINGRTHNGSQKTAWDEITAIAYPAGLWKESVELGARDGGTA